MIKALLQGQRTPEIVLSKHATERILTREYEEGVVCLTMSPDDVLDFLQQSVHVETTQHPVPDKPLNPRITYWVFYSPGDNAYFVAVGKKLRETILILTVIPINKKKKWQLSHPVMKHARAKACQYIGFVPLQFIQRLAVPPTTYRVSCAYRGDNDKPKFTNLFSFPGKDLTEDIESVVQSAEFLEKCVQAAESKGIDKSRLVYVLVRLGPKGDPLISEIDEYATKRPHSKEAAGQFTDLRGLF